MPPPPSAEVRAIASSLALAAFACGANAESRTDDTAQTPPTTPSGVNVEPPRSESSPPPGDVSEPAVEEGPSDVQLGGSPCLVADLVADDTPTGDMAAFVMRHQDFARRTLYSWTTAEQVRELRQNPTLLTRAATAEGEPGRAAEVIQSHAASDELAALLAGPRFENKRFGWSNAWATVRGFGGERYGEHLLRITLREQAWVGRLIVSQDNRIEWAFADVRGNPIAAADVLRSPERVAAVYFADLRDAGCGTLGSGGSTFREYFVCNEAMLESYALYTDDVRAEIDRSIEALAGLRQALLDGRCSTVEYCWPDVALAEWGAAGAADAALGERYVAALAFPSEQYSPTPANIAELLRLLGALPFEAPLLHTYAE